ncbi:MAG: DUF4391 domain-containing protein [Bacilli bacterium]
MEKLPDSCYVGKIIPKDNFKQYRDEFTNKVERIRFMYSISGQTTNYEQTDDADTIVVINLSLKEDTGISNIIKEIEQTINFKILYEIEFNNKKKYGFYDQKLFTTSYDSQIIFDLLANDVVTLYENLKKQIIGSSKKELSVDELVKRQLEIEQLEKEIEKLTKEKSKEMQVNKKNEIRKQIKKLITRVKRLKNVQ